MILLDILFDKTIISLVLGLFIGFIYGLFFVYSRKRALTFNSSKDIIFSSVISGLRLTALLTLFFYLLRLKSINFIILLQAFFIAFWFTIYKRGT